MPSSILSVCYLIGSVTFIVGLKMLSHPETARRGNWLAAAGMVISILGTLFLYRHDGEHLHNYGWIAGGLVIGSVVGTMAARQVKMTAMPQMVSLFNGMGGLCAMLIAVIEFNRLLPEDASVTFAQVLESRQLSLYVLAILAGLVIGGVSFAGSVIAFGKLDGKISDRNFAGQQVVNMAVITAIAALSVYLICGDPRQPALIFYTVTFLSLFYGVLFVIPIGGADMPVVISLLNSFTGVATAFGGFLYDNQVMLTGGILVGSAGTILTIMMCKAMNRSIRNVLLGSFSATASGGPVSGGEQGNYKEIGLNDLAILMAYARKVMIVPGYGLAVAQAQHVCHEMEKLLRDKGVEVKYAIHPVAGRMPGHMNVLLAEANVSYDELLDLEPANDALATADVVLILGANDVVNTAAKNDPSSPIYGMPILEVGKAKAVVVNKRSMRPGYAGIDNALFSEPNTSMLFGDAKSVLQNLAGAIKEL
ncbi:NAD(P)(+) transhydrogenase (Re/Si-specific) subunit beta [Pedobacter sp. HMF7056]|uniref:NAD(P) transhydrogenase subunit beta n=1 Tax=Hufsiella ginkgonis TaxID=2695274 RepID=A0A7K1XYC5_9SPHI|nr:NAD(P)(+) transhydrogenase (Re/Si-specific) subunit beta [Hufsiella ginkgonis]